MDLSKLGFKDTTQVNITLPNGEPTDISIEVAGQDSDEFRKAEVAKRNRRLKAAQKGKKITAEQLDEEGLDLLVNCTVSWQNVFWGKDEMECTPENVRKLYTEHPFIREQIDEAIADRTLFM